MRNYNEELKDTVDHKYGYNFDYDIMHHFMIKAFEPFFVNDNVLELGSNEGRFTKRLQEYFDRIHCVEASEEAVKKARRNLLNETRPKEDTVSKIKVINSTFENYDTYIKYDNIVMTHVLEHLDNPVAVLKRINDEWLTDTGRFFLVVPNANAPSRQIAVKMGIISHNTAITPSEALHGHKITYTLDTLERDVKQSGLNIIHRSGIFFKAFSNFQWDRILEQDGIVTDGFLEGCYKLGQQYPDLCASLFFVCEKGK